MSEKQIHISDVIFSSIFTVCVILILYFIAERFAIIPVIYSEYISQSQIEFYSKISLSDNEKTIIMILLFEIGWISSQLVYWRLRKYQIKW